MKIVGLTGGIGSGKTYVSKIFSQLGVPVYYSDARAKELYQSDLDLKSEMIELFSDEVYESNGEINKTFLAKEIFNDPEKLERVNNLVHPAVKRDFEKWTLAQSAQYVIKEAAILIESKGHLNCDHVILVSAPKDLKISRIRSRDGSTIEQIQDRMSKQLSDDEKRPFSQFEIINDESKLLIPQIMSIHEDLVC